MVSGERQAVCGGGLPEEKLFGGKWAFDPLSSIRSFPLQGVPRLPHIGRLSASPPWAPMNPVRLYLGRESGEKGGILS